MNNRHDLSDNTWLKSQPSDAHSGRLTATFLTWPLWVIWTPGVWSSNWKWCALRGYCSFVLHEISQAEETTTEEMDNWKATPRNVFLKISYNARIQDGWLTERPAAGIITPRCGLTMFWLFSVISCSHSYAKKFVICLRNKARLYL